METKLEQTKAQLDRLDFQMICAINSDNAYFTSGRYDRDRREYLALITEMGLSS
jgi:hypothetical protein